ncbi:uncharacterized protein LOC114326446 [Diabrotica virgifera virgifera]|nr:uncharacterized protein LOC114326446 [Diabrotica virgifera virgifera]
MSNVLDQIAKQAVEETCDTKFKDIATQTVIENDIVKKAMEQIKNLQTENKKLKELLSREKEEKSTVERIFTEGQLKKLKTKKQIKWSIEDFASAIPLHAAGARSYRLLRKRGYFLSAVGTLRRWDSRC